MAKFGEIVAYAYRADLYCPECIVKVVDPSELLIAEDDSINAEADLDILAALRGIEREHEETFDSDDFPKVVLFDNLHDQGRTFNCGNCHRELES